ncbi:MAG TPA: hypothetical protein VEJ36_07085 [Nitrososphaerales archaeon]|nr:hypothetical protein [Nitrososphaerales archaeon]
MERHLRRCGTRHKHVAASPYVATATSSIETVGPRGVLTNAPSRKGEVRRHRGKLRRILHI